MATRLHLALFFFALTACTTRTVVDTAPADGGAAPAPVVHATPNAPDAPDTEDEATDTSPPAPRPAEKRGEPGADSGAAPKEVMTGGTITLTCPKSGFHEKPPVTIASVPASLQHRCSARTRDCWLAARTSAEADACLAADNTPAAVVEGKAFDCAACERTQGAFCMAHACSSEFGTYGCCAQSGAPCSGQLDNVVECTGARGKAEFTKCVGDLVRQCFP